MYGVQGRLIQSSHDLGPNACELTGTSVRLTNHWPSDRMWVLGVDVGDGV
jgi:hypothetical protein